LLPLALNLDLDDDKPENTRQRAHVRDDIWHEERPLWDVGERFRIAEKV